MSILLFEWAAYGVLITLFCWHSSYDVMVGLGSYRLCIYMQEGQKFTQESTFMHQQAIHLKN